MATSPLRLSPSAPAVRSASPISRSSIDIAVFIPEIIPMVFRTVCRKSALTGSYPQTLHRQETRKPLAALHPHKIGQRGLLQRFEKRLERIGQHAAERTNRQDPARILLQVEAFHNTKVRLGLLHHFTDIDPLGIARQRHSARSPRRGIHET